MLPNLKQNADGSVTIYNSKERAGQTRKPIGCHHRTDRSTCSETNLCRRIQVIGILRDQEMSIDVRKFGVGHEKFGENFWEMQFVCRA